MDESKIYCSSGASWQALALHEQEKLTYQALGDQRSLAITLGDIARIYAAEGRVAEAKALQLTRLGTKLGRADGVAVVGSSLGAWLCAAEQWDLAARVLEPALVMAERLGANGLTQRIQRSLEQVGSALAEADALSGDEP